MNREINFRGKRVDNGEWVTGDLIHGQGSKYGRMYILPQSHIYPKGCNELDGWDVIPETVGQFTGLKDYNKTNKIWENDIVSNGIRNYVVKFLNGCFWMVNGNGLAVNRLIERVDEIKVLGNVHDNLGLIK